MNSTILHASLFAFCFEVFFFPPFLFRERSNVRSWKLQEHGVGGLNRRLPFLNVHNWQKGRCRHSPFSLKYHCLPNGTLRYCCPPPLINCWRSGVASVVQSTFRFFVVVGIGGRGVVRRRKKKKEKEKITQNNVTASTKQLDSLRNERNRPHTFPSRFCSLFT